MTPFALAVFIWIAISVPVSLLVGALFSTAAGRLEPARVIVLPEEPTPR